MERAVLPNDVKPDEEHLYRHLFEKAMGIPIQFNSVPTASDIEPNSWGFYGNDVYMKFSNGTAIKLTGSAVS